MSVVAWKCICGELVDARYPAHTHASIPNEWDDLEMKERNLIGHPPEIWTYNRSMTDRDVILSNRDDEGRD